MTSILIVEDEPSIRENLAEILHFSGYTPLTAADGIEAELLLETNTPDLILCDVMMPNRDGFELLALVRQHPTLFDVPFILLTARSDPKDMRQGMNLGADDYLIKPFEIGELIQTVGMRLSMSRRASRLGLANGLPLV
ncbi:MAG: response regulator transcription factor [Burkholderiaceae bacterium]